MKVTVYSKPGCVQCVATTRAMDARCIEYNVVDLSQDAAKASTMSADGHRQLPIVEIDDKILWSGFRPDLIIKL